jgi:ATP-binding cassette subfamily F protein 3
VAGSVRWGHGCEIGVYAQHVYSSLDPKLTVLEYLESKANPGTTHQQILTVAGSLLFRDEHVRKKVQVLSGGERARLCMAGLLLGTYNILVLDEPGNHLDVETVESLAEALLAYRGTVIFTSHDRHFMSRLATDILEVRDGTAKNYAGDYEAYLYYINKEIEEGERTRAPTRAKLKKTKMTEAPTASRVEVDPKQLRKELKNIERTIKTLDARRSELHAQLMQTTDAAQALSLHNEMKAVEMELGEAEERWLELNSFD